MKLLEHVEITMAQLAFEANLSHYSLSSNHFVKGNVIIDKLTMQARKTLPNSTAVGEEGELHSAQSKSPRVIWGRY